MSSGLGNHITWLSGVKQEIQDLNGGFESSVNLNKCSINSKFNDINNQLKDIKKNFKKSVLDIVTESISKAKDSIIEAQRKENFNSKNLEAKLFELQKASSKQDQYTGRNNLEIHGIPVEVKDDQIEDKIINMFSQLNVSISIFDIEDCYQLGKSNTVVRFIN